MNTTDQRPEHTGVKPTIVLVHGAYADASSWNGVIERLQQQRYTVIAPANPLRGVTADSAYTASLLNQIDGPVLLVGHSYAGAVITNAATSTPNVVGLVYIAAFATEEGENLNDVESGSTDSILGAGADITEVEGSHVIMISQPQAVTDVIVTAAKAVAGSR